MTRSQGVMLIAGSIVLVSTLLGAFYSHYWYLLTGFVGLNLVQYSFTGFCPAEKFLAYCGVKDGPMSCAYRK